MTSAVNAPSVLWAPRGPLCYLWMFSILLLMQGWKPFA